MAISGVRTKKLNIIPDERGFLMEMMRSDSKEFEKFGQVYLTVGDPGIVKGWHYHKKQTDNFFVVKGMIKLVLFDMRDGSETKGELNEFFVGEKNPIQVQIPPVVVHGFKALGGESAYIINLCTEVYNYEKPDEYRIPISSNEIPYEWEVKEG
jgi:dTDP-4-dehydrorhamnose 3,5-epimerase